MKRDGENSTKLGDQPSASSLAFRPIQISRSDYEELMYDPYYRTMKNSSKISHALVLQLPTGARAYQFDPPAPSTTDAGVASAAAPRSASYLSEFRPITEIYKVSGSDDDPRYGARTPGGTELIARRSLNMLIDTPETGAVVGRLDCFSPRPNDSFLYWGGKIPNSIVRSLEENEQEEVVDDLKEAGVSVKGGVPLDVDHPSVVWRKSIKTRNPTQNAVMKESAVDAYQSVLEQFGDILSEDVKKIMEEAVKAPLNNPFHSNKRPEWLHLYGFGLTPQEYDPQVVDNLGAAPKWCNTEMMIVEHIAQWLAQVCAKDGREDVIVKVLPLFEMMFGTHIVKHIDFRLKMMLDGRSIEFIQSINPFQSVIFRKKSDVAQGAVVVSDLISGTFPDREVPIRTSALSTKNATAINFSSGAHSLSGQKREAGVESSELSVAPPLKRK
jgi:hypothetical protein